MKKNEKQKVLICLPSFNEGKVLENFLKELKKKNLGDILIVNDCSKDNTKEICQNLKVNCLTHILNRGAGGARITGLEYAKKENYDFLIYMDSDGQHKISDLKELLENKNKADLIIGKRNIFNKNMPLLNRISNIIGRVVVYLICGKWVEDSQSGFKILNKKVINKINLTYDRYENDSEFVFECAKNNLSIKEIPIEVIYTNHSKTKGHGQRWYKGFGMIGRFIFK